MTRRASRRPLRIGMTVMELMRWFPNDKAAEAWFEASRWPDGRFCPDCGSANTVAIASRKPMPYRCRDCRAHFSVRKGTVMQSSNLGLQKWAIALCMMTTGIRGTSSIKLYREVGIRQATAWFLMRRIREGFIKGRDSPFPGPVGKTIVAGAEDQAGGHATAAATGHGDAKPLQRFGPDRPEGRATVDSMGGVRSIFRRGRHGTFHHPPEKHPDLYVRGATGRNDIRDFNTPDRMAFPARPIAGNRIRYAGLVA